jgi:hypothetical protein
MTRAIRCVATFAAPGRPCRVVRPETPARATRCADPGPRPRVAGLGRDRPAGGGPSGYRRPAAPSPEARRPPARAPGLDEIEAAIRTCGAHLLASYRNGFIPTYAAFNLIGDVDLRGRELLMALTGLQSRSYKNSTRLFNLARIFIARARPQTDQPALDRHRRTDAAADANGGRPRAGIRAARRLSPTTNLSVIAVS